MLKENLRLSYKDAEQVHVLQTNAGYYGDFGAIGHINICVNDGNIQPFCVNSESKMNFQYLKKKNAKHAI